MHIKVSDILASDIGQSVSYAIADERPELADVDLGDDLTGELAVAKTNRGLLVRGQLLARVNLDCHRCLEAFALPLAVDLFGEFSEQPVDDQWPITPGVSIDLAPMVRQELLVNLPIKQLCSIDCPGLCLDCGQRLTPQHSHHLSPTRKD